MPPFVCLEYSWLRHLQFNALASLFVILLVELKADEVSLLSYGCDGGGATAYTVV